MPTLIQVKNVHKAYGSNVIFDDASVDLSHGDRIGVIGRNGAGKTTLLKLILGQEELDDGSVVKSSGLRLSQLEQQSPFGPGEAVLPFLMRDSGREEWHCARMAARFQLGNDLLDEPVGTLPGGYQTRVKIVAMMLGEPNFLLLDEPTNYLDLRTLILLERFLEDFNGGYLVVSHDREFLKRVCRQMLEVERGRLFLFPGDVESYLRFRDEQLEQAIRQNRNVEAQKKHLQNFVDRYRVRAATASRAQSKLKQIQKLDAIEIDNPASTARIKIPPVEPRRGVALKCTDLAIGYPDRLVADEIRFEIERGEHVAVLGDNGEGKTTFLRTIADQLAPVAGALRWGHGLTCGFYAQHVYTALDPALDVHTHLRRQAARDVVDQDILDMAGSFLFSGDDVHKSIAVLSGGERARVCLAGLLLARRSVLLLDEPTNHLDFETVEALGKALRDYCGTVFLVSHDRTFVKLVATNIVEVRGGQVRLYPGDYDGYVCQVQREAVAAVDGATATKPPASTASARSAGRGPERKKSEFHRRKERRAGVKRLKKRIAETESQMAGHQEERDAIHQHFLEHPLDHSPEKQRRDRELDQLIGTAEARWLLLQEELEGLGTED